MSLLFSSYSFARCGPAAAVRPQAAPRLGRGPPPLRRWAVQRRGRRQSVRPAAQLKAAGNDNESFEWVGRNYGGSNDGKLLRLRPLAALAGVANTAALSRAVAALGPGPEQRVLEHGAAVAGLLLSLGVPRAQLAQLLQRCPLLFSWPPEQRAAVLFGQLARLGLTAAEAARCFVQQPVTAGVASFEPATPALAGLLTGGSKAGSGKSGEQLLGDLLRKQPSALVLLCSHQATLQQRISNLVQRYGPHWEQDNKEAVIVTAVQGQNWALLNSHPEHLLSLEAMLQQEVGQQPGDGARLLASILQHQALTATCSAPVMQQRARALVAQLGRTPLLQAKAQPVAMALGCKTAQWQVALAVWRLLGVADPAALATRNLKLVAVGWLQPALLAAIAALQQLLPWQPTAAEVVQRFATYPAINGPERLIGRLLFLQQEGLLPLLVADKRAARQQWRQRRRLPSNRRVQGEPLFMSLRDTAVLPTAKLCTLLAEAEAAQLKQPPVIDSSVAERYCAFMAQLPQLPAYQQLLAAGQAESRRLAALLPPELRSDAVEQEDAEEM